MKHRKLRIAFSAVCGILCLLLIVLWVRSYWWADALWYRPGNTIAFRVMSDEGAVRFLSLGADVLDLGDPPPKGWSRRKYWYAGYASDVVNASPFKKVFREFDRPNRFVWQAPYWLPAIITAALTTSPWPKWRFSLRTLLIAMTLVAVVLGFFAAT